MSLLYTATVIQLFFFLVFNVTQGPLLTLLSKCSSHKGDYCISVSVTSCIILCTLDLHTKKKECISQVNHKCFYLIQLCLFISLEGFNRWKLGSSVSNKLDKQTKNRCRASFQNAVYPLWKKKSFSEIYLYYHVWICSLKLLHFSCKQTSKNDKGERVAVGVIVFQQVDISFWNRTLHLVANFMFRNVTHAKSGHWINNIHTSLYFYSATGLHHSAFPRCEATIDSSCWFALLIVV